MSSDAIIDGAIWYLGLIIIVTLHEFAHAWTAWKLGDDTARLQGRVTLNPAAHIDPIGTVALPLLIIFLSAIGSGLSRFIIGWGKPVPFDPSQLRRRGFDETLIAMAGPAMNILLAIGLAVVARVFQAMGLLGMVDVTIQIAILSLFLCFFNLLPVPPLDGSHLMRHLTGMSSEAYLKLSRFGLIIVIVLLQIPMVTGLLRTATFGTFQLIAFATGLRVSG